MLAHDVFFKLKDGSDASKQKLVDACKDEKFKLAEVKEADLPEAMKKMSQAERAKHVEEMGKKRADLQQKIQALDGERQKFVAGASLEMFDPAKHDVLVWLGCAGAFEADFQKSLRSLFDILRAKNVRFGVLSKELWDGHPCCAFAASKEFITTMPNTYAALLKSIIDATAFAHKAENRKQIAAAIAPANYLNQPETVLEQILTGTYADGLGNVKRDPNRIDFDPFPWQSFAIWILTQMKRWGQIKGDVDYKAVAEQVYLATDTAKLMQEAGLTPPEARSKSFKVMGKEFDPAKPEDYLNSFAIKRA